MIRRRYSGSVPIIIRQDAGYFDQKLFNLDEELEVAYVGGGKLYNDIKDISTFPGGNVLVVAPNLSRFDQ